ncbi:uncharacterized protein ARMOST_15318 [Armillaria ostoyae]|uniref:Uncharacterized protein n=1 Tax=Armillaria ostoyae TaxID=47428 RepID=A0A284RT11_ARMOS|nr:uncharacterized protein ARMOST_15318 [Armillaria ostoyae]
MIQCTSIIHTLRRADGSKTKQDAGSQSGRYDGHHHYVACRVSELGLEKRANVFPVQAHNASSTGYRAVVAAEDLPDSFHVLCIRSSHRIDYWREYLGRAVVLVRDFQTGVRSA